MNGEGVLCAKLVPNICSICVDVMGACVPNAGIICMLGSDDDDDDDDADDDFVVDDCSLASSDSLGVKLKYSDIYRVINPDCE